MIVERTHDIEWITKCVTHPKVWAMTADDGCGDPGLLFPSMEPPLIWLKAGECGVFLGHPHNCCTLEVHTILPFAHEHALEAAKKAISWTFENTEYERIITNVPSFNPAAYRLALKSGMEKIGVNKKSFKKDGVLYDQVLLGISKEDCTNTKVKSEA